MVITATKLSNRPGYRCQFRHPLTKSASSFSLGRDEQEAHAICRDLEAIFADSELLADRDSPRLVSYHPRAIEIAFGEDARNKADERRIKPVLEEDDIGTLTMRILGLLERSKDKKKDLRAALIQYESKRYSDLFKQYQRLENHVKALTPLSEEVERLRRQTNKHVTTSIGAAIEKWKVDYKAGHARVTVKQAFTAVDAFVNALPNGSRFKLSDVRSQHIDDWLREAKRLDGKPDPLSQVSKKRMKAYLSSFFTDMVRDYDLSENPLEKSKPLAGISRNPEHIRAIRRLTELQAYFDAMISYPYWRAWCAVAIFAGPRYAEQVWLKINDVYIDEGYIRITSRASGRRILGTKTGRERNIPIEQTFLKDILAEHLKTRHRERSEGMTSAEKSQWLFPTVVPQNVHRKRVVSEDGQWSDNGVFLGAWKRTLAQITAKMKKPLPEYWSYGPDEWRHCFGTTLGHCGWTSLEISHAMGNSEEICRRHYVVPPTGQRWPYKFSVKD